MPLKPLTKNIRNTIFPVNENYGVLRFTSSTNELSINRLGENSVSGGQVSSSLEPTHPRKPVTTSQAPSIHRLHGHLGFPFGDHDSQIAVTRWAGALEIPGHGTIESARRCRSRRPRLHRVPARGFVL